MQHLIQAGVLVWSARRPALVPPGIVQVPLAAKGQGYLRNCKAGAVMIGIFSHKYSLNINDGDEIIKAIGSFFQNKLRLKTCRDVLPFHSIIEN